MKNTRIWLMAVLALILSLTLIACTGDKPADITVQETVKRVQGLPDAVIGHSSLRIIVGAYALGAVTRSHLGATR